MQSGFEGVEQGGEVSYPDLLSKRISGPALISDLSHDFFSDLLSGASKRCATFKDHIPGTVDAFPAKMKETIVRIATPRSLLVVTADARETRRRLKNPKMTTKLLR